MQLSTLVKIVIVAAVVYFGVKYWNDHYRGNAPSAGAPSKVAEASCVPAAEAASGYWGSGIGRFANPPYDMDAWSSFRSGVEERMARADRTCSCSDQSCTRAQEAMRDLRALVSEMDSAMRNSTPPPSDLVQRQQRIDEAIEAAHDLVREGK